MEAQGGEITTDIGRPPLPIEIGTGLGDRVIAINDLEGTTLTIGKLYFLLYINSLCKSVIYIHFQFVQ